MKPWENNPNWNKPVGKKRNKIEIKVWMLRNGLNNTQLAKEAGLSSPCGVSLTIAGRKNIRKVLRLLVKKGCPANILDLPTDMRM